MSPTQARNTEESNELPVLNFIPAELVEMNKQRVEALVEAQKELFEAFAEIHQAWFDRARSMATINTELLTKLSSARTVPETANAYQQSMGKRMELMVEGGREFFADSQKIVNLGTKFLANGHGRNGSAD